MYKSGGGISIFGKIILVVGIVAAIMGAFFGKH